MCKQSPGKRCSSHVLEKIGTLENHISTLDESIKKLDFKLKTNRNKDSNYDETEEGQRIIQERLTEFEELKEKHQQLHEEKASFYITETGQNHLQEIIDNPDSTAREVNDALMHHNTAFMRKQLDTQVMALVKDEEIPLKERYALVTHKIGSIEKEIENISEREEVIKQNIEKAEKKAETFATKGMHQESAEWRKNAQLYKQEQRYLDSYKNQLASFASNVKKWQERTLKEIDMKAEEAIDQTFNSVEKSIHYAAALW